MTNKSLKISNFKLKICFVILLTFLATCYLLPATISRAQECGSDLDCQISQIQKEIDARLPAQEKNKQDLVALRKEINSLNSRIAALSQQVSKLSGSIDQREKDLGYAQKILEEKAQNHYRFIRLYDPVMPFITADDASTVFKEIAFRQRTVGGDILTMKSYSNDLIKLKNDKASVEKSKISLAAAQKIVNERASFLQSEVDKVESALASLSAKQNELIAAKAGGFQTSIGDTPPTLEPCSGAPGSSNFCDPGFKPAFAAFSFGAPHRTGMSQYGAYGRSKSGQSAETILSAYYQGASLNKSYAVPATIGVTGKGRIPFEDNYLLGIYEVPESWGDSGGFEALKAQAVAARSYALYATNNGSGTICATEFCQVYKSQLKSGKWAEAVRATRGWVMTKGSTAAPTYFSASTGGFTISQWGWSGIKDTAGAWPDGAYEKIASSPWFYKGWFRSRGGISCGRNHPWLTGAEVADILNAWQIVTKGGGDVSRVSPTGSCWGGNPYSISELSGIGGFNSVSSVSSPIYGNDGSTVSITFSTNKGLVTIPGAEFKKAFNLRAPGYIGLKSSLFNIEKL